MKPADLALTAAVSATATLFLLFPPAAEAYASLNAAHGFLMSFIKFAVLATLGECLALRITDGIYLRPGFGILPRMLVWGVLGMVIKAAFIIFATGAPHILSAAGFGPELSLRSPSFGNRLAAAFCVSVSMNCIFAPVMMVCHRVTDEHILRSGGTLHGLFSGMNVADILSGIHWNVLWNFVFRKTIPLFWIPAHTITFLLPAEMQVLFAALLSVALGVILAVASLRGRQHA